MTTIHHQLLIDAPVSRVYDVIATAEGISTWWDKQTPKKTERGLVLEHSRVVNTASSSFSSLR
jgi:uncharacterized protein YndB with AHSA1/START domain